MEDSIVLYPAPGMGHIVSMVELGKLILRHYNHQFSITILLITTDLFNPPTVDTFIHNVTQAHPLISFRRLPRIPVDTTPVRSPAAMVFECIGLNARHALHSLEEISRTSNIRAFVIDLFCSSALPVGKGLKIPTYYFFTSGAACLSAFLYFPKVHEKQYSKSFKDLPDTDLHFPGMTKPLRAIHMPEPLLEKDDPSYHDFLYFCTQLQKADGILVNTFEDLEPMAIKTIADGACVPDAPTPPPTYYIGPLIAAGGENKGDQHDDCVSWLDKQPSKSVVFLCFGSRGSFTAEQVKEIAKGLERSGQRFLWVVKNLPFDEKRKQTTDMSDFDLDEILPEGFLERVKDRGLVVKSWAPQVAVLSHDSVGGFVTHCGWNSVLETVVAGVPMVAWPLYAEQHLNRNLLVEDVKLAIAVEQRDEDGFVKGDELERRIRELMESDRGREIRERSLQIRDMAVAAWGMSGSSTRAIAKLFETWKS